MSKTRTFFKGSLSGNHYLLQMLKYSFNLVVACQFQRPSHLMKLDKLCRKYRIPFLVCHSYGFIGYLRLSLPEHHGITYTFLRFQFSNRLVVETHPENVIDLRLDCPWPELLHHCQLVDIPSLDSMEQSHLPFIVILIQLMQQWTANVCNQV